MLADESGQILLLTSRPDNRYTHRHPSFFL